MNFYTGIGSRSAPANILGLMHKIAVRLLDLNFTLRSGGASGSDSAFESGAGTDKQIFLAKHSTPAAMAIAAEHHPAWDRCSEYARKLHARNVFQILGSDLSSPSKFVICWTPDGCYNHATRSIRTGGTGTAISIAANYGVPVFNLAIRSHLDRLERFANKNTHK